MKAIRLAQFRFECSAAVFSAARFMKSVEAPDFSPGSTAFRPCGNAAPTQRALALGIATGVLRLVTKS